MTIDPVSVLRAVVVSCALLLPAAANAHEYKIGPITVVNPWARATPVKVGGAYMTLENSGSASDRLIKITSPDAASVELHETRIESGTAMMRQVAAIEIKAGARTELKPGGLHVMLMGLTRPLKEGETLKLTLTFEKSGTIEVDATIDKAGAPGGHKH